MEILTSLDTSTFMLAYRRFVALRGNCVLLRSDHGTNFIGARGQYDNEMNKTNLINNLEAKGCKWEMIPPKASHMGGVWERKIGSFKKVLNASLLLLKSRLLCYDEFVTLVMESASIVNNTPLSDIPCNPNEPFPVSPGMLLTHRENFTFSPEDFNVDDLLSYGSKRWRRVQYLSDQFWLRWKREFLLNQQARNKWIYPRRNLSVGDVVMLKDSTPRNTWPLGIVSEIFPSKDGLVRRVTIKLKSDFLGKCQFRERAIHDLVLLIPHSVSPGSVMTDHEKILYFNIQIHVNNIIFFLFS